MRAAGSLPRRAGAGGPLAEGEKESVSRFEGRYLNGYGAHASVETYTELTPQGRGEPALVAVGAVVASAIFDATGARLFQMPMTAVRVKEALGKRT